MQQARPPSTFDIFMCNITTWGPKAEAFSTNVQWPIQVLPEHHLRGQRLSDVVGALRHKGYRATASEARPSGRTESGTSGGAMVVARSHIKLIHTILDDGGQPMASSGHDWAAVTVRTSGITIVVVGLYMTTGWPGSVNQGKLREVANYIMTAGLPFIVLGDFNCTPEDFLQHGWHSLVGGKVVVPDVQFTCTTPPSRIIDFAVVSLQVADLLLSFGAEGNSPFRPHVGLLLRLRSKARSVCKRVLVKPRDIPKPECLGAAERDSELWLEAQRRASQKLDSTQIGILGRPSLRLVESQETSQWGVGMQLGQKWANFCLTSEMFMLARVGVHPEDFGPYLGRGQFPVFRAKPVVPRTHPERQAGTREVEFWSVLAARLRELSVLRQRSVGFGQQSHIVQFIGRHVEVGTRDLGIPDEWRGKVADLWGVGHLDIMLLVRDTAKSLAAAQRVASVEISKSVSNWLSEALKKGSGPAHKHARKDFGLPPPAEQALLDGVWQDEPILVMDGRSRAWAAFWRRDKEKRARLGVVLSRLRGLDAEKGGSFPLFQIEDLNLGLSRIHNATALGMDLISPVDLKGLPCEAKQCLVEVIREVERLGAWPVQTLHVLIALLGKPDGGDRPIALLNMVYRIWTKSRGVIETSWEEERAGFWDTAIKGSSALRAAVWRAFKDELATEGGLVAATVLWDLTKFYDTIDLLRLVVSGVDMGYSPLALGLSVQMYLAPRYLRANQCFDQGVVPFTGIVAGCGRAVRFTRIVLYGVLEKAHSAFPRVVPTSFVDDLTQRVEGSAVEVLDLLPRAADLLAEGLQEIGCTISPKSAATCNNHEVALGLNRRFGAYNLPIRVKGMVRDLGVSNTSGKRRSAKILESVCQGPP